MNQSRPELMEEVKLHDSPKERAHYDNLADLYAVINTLQCLERAYIRDCVKTNEYEAACNKLLAQYKTAFRLVQSSEFPDVDSFVKKYRLDCVAALERIKDDQPVKVRSEKTGNSNKCIADIVSLFITTSDCLKLERRAKDDIYPLVREICDALSSMTSLPANFEAKTKMNEWLKTLGEMSVSDELSDDQTRQLTFDLDVSYNAFIRTLKDENN
ncbi:vacuolar protein sorting-associated protein 28 homolog [Symsagittifera roscoffensis]|uniref:vacuolar protein sorting-associated protein 28 homolog n=1 Tax=Symsagittifera roscoffensis TaxID=84072 RepID=UPI00307BE52D